MIQAKLIVSTFKCNCPEDQSSRHMNVPCRELPCPTATTMSLETIQRFRKQTKPKQKPSLGHNTCACKTSPYIYENPGLPSFPYLFLFFFPLFFCLFCWFLLTLELSGFKYCLSPWVSTLKSLQLIYKWPIRSDWALVDMSWNGKFYLEISCTVSSCLGPILPLLSHQQSIVDTLLQLRPWNSDVGLVSKWFVVLFSTCRIMASSYGWGIPSLSKSEKSVRCCLRKGRSLRSIKWRLLYGQITDNLGTEFEMHSRKKSY